MNQQSNSSNATIVCGDFNACYHKHAGNLKGKTKGKISLTATETKQDEHLGSSAALSKTAVITEPSPPEAETEVPVVSINKKPPSRAFKKNWNRRQGGRGRGKGSAKEANGNADIDSEGRKLTSSQKSFEPWATHCCLINPIADYCLGNNRIMYTRYCGDIGTGFIDHQLHFPMNVTCTGFQTTTSAQWTALGISDHRPLAATYNVSGGRRTELSRKITSKEYKSPVFDKKR